MRKPLSRFIQQAGVPQWRRRTLRRHSPPSHERWRRAAPRHTEYPESVTT
ncbi:MAG: hypothetical protein DRO93_00940 [Candidatus Thorarchaeota archaeon]|nr:MAG: hypothetical protein DRO93_00940 [Candidatus Thorarchaeota archaeon]